MDKNRYPNLGAIIGDMKNVRIPYEGVWLDIDRVVAPGMCRLQLSDTDRGDVDDGEIANSTAEQAFCVAENGMVSSLTNPYTRWLAIKPAGDPELAEFGPAAQWYEDVASAMLDATEESGTYESFQSLYGYGLKFSNGLLWMEENFERVLSSRVIPTGQWWVAKDYFGDVRFIYREFRSTVRNTVETFGRRTAKGGYDWSNFSSAVRSAWDDAKYQTTVDIGHIVMPNDRYDGNGLEKRFKSCYFELASGRTGGGDSYAMQEGVFLREGGYDEIPGLLFQWQVTGDDVYGLRCPGLTSRMDIKELNHWTRKRMAAMDKMVDPPLYGPAWAKMIKVNSFPGQITAVPDNDLQRGGLRQLHETPVQTLAVDDLIRNIETRINMAWYVDVFRRISYLEPDSKRTATEVHALSDENYRQLISPLSRLIRGVLNPYTSRLFNYLYTQGRLPPPPEELEGQPIKIEYVSNMAQAMRSTGINSIRTMLETGLMLAKDAPQVWNKLDIYQSMDELAKATGAPARMMRGDEQVAALEAEQQKAAQAQAQAEQLQMLTKGVQSLASAPTDPDEPNALTDVMGALGGGGK